MTAGPARRSASGRLASPADMRRHCGGGPRQSFLRQPRAGLDALFAGRRRSVKERRCRGGRHHRRLRRP